MANSELEVFRDLRDGPLLAEGLFGLRVAETVSPRMRVGAVAGSFLCDCDEKVASALAECKRRLAAELAIEHRPVVEADPEKALVAARGPVDLLIVNCAAKSFDGLRLCAQIRSDEATPPIGPARRSCIRVGDFGSSLGATPGRLERRARCPACSTTPKAVAPTV